MKLTIFIKIPQVDIEGEIQQELKHRDERWDNNNSYYFNKMSFLEAVKLCPEPVEGLPAVSR